MDTERRWGTVRLFVAGLLWAPIASVGLNRSLPLWLPLSLGIVLLVASGPFPRWSRTRDRLAWCLSYGALLTWVWLPAQAGVELAPGTVWAGVALLAALALGSIRPGELPTGWGVALVALGALVAFFSGSPGSADPWFRFFRETLGMSKEMADAAVFTSRKAVHFMGYGVFAWIVLREARSQGLPWRSAAFAALLWVAPHAAFDEADQLFSGSRNASVLDVGVDLLGASAFLFGAWKRRD